MKQKNISLKFSCEPSSLQILNASPRGVGSKILVEQIKTVRLAAPADE
jgi:hypothetical protein